MRPLQTILISDIPDQHQQLIQLIENDLRFSLTIQHSSDPIEQGNQMVLILCDQYLCNGSGYDFFASRKKTASHSIHILINATPGDPRLSNAFQHGLLHFFLTRPFDQQLAEVSLGNAWRQWQNFSERNSLQDKLKAELTSEALAPLRESLVMVANHELRTPATIIHSSLDLLDSQSEGLNEIQRRYIKCAKNGMQRLNQLLNRCSNLMASGNGAIDQPFKPICLSQLLTYQVRAFQQICKERHILLNLETMGDTMVLGHQSSLLQVFENLISNAIKYTPDYGEISISLRSGARWVSISVRDNGLGIKNSELENIFESFYQLSDPKKHHSSGTAFKGGGPGLGLAVCRTVVQSHRGVIWAESPGIDQGSTFAVRLPRYFSRKNDVTGTARPKSNGPNQKQGVTQQYEGLSNRRMRSGTPRRQRLPLQVA